MTHELSWLSVRNDARGVPVSLPARKSQSSSTYSRVSYTFILLQFKLIGYKLQLGKYKSNYAHHKQLVINHRLLLIIKIRTELNPNMNHYPKAGKAYFFLNKLIEKRPWPTLRHWDRPIRDDGSCSLLSATFPDVSLWVFVLLIYKFLSSLFREISEFILLIKRILKG